MRANSWRSSNGRGEWNRFVLMVFGLDLGVFSLKGVGFAFEGKSDGFIDGMWNCCSSRITNGRQKVSSMILWMGFSSAT